jgi:acetyl-CoA carboxylase biotin carboxylase subunit
VGPVPPAAVIEMRINAEDPNADFQPNSGDITRLVWPKGPGIRIDTQIEEGYRFPPFYDSLMAKLIVRAHNRDAAVAAATAAVRNVTIDGLKTTLPMHAYVLAHPDFIAGGIPTSWFGPVWEARKESLT